MTMEEVLGQVVLKYADADVEARRVKNEAERAKHQALTAGIKDKLNADTQARHILNYNGANLAFTHAMDIANKLGLNEKQQAGITPFPCPTNTTNILNFSTDPIGKAVLESLGGQSLGELPPQSRPDTKPSGADQVVSSQDPLAKVEEQPFWKKALYPVVAAAGITSGILGGAAAWNASKPTPPPDVHIKQGDLHLDGGEGRVGFSISSRYHGDTGNGE